MKYHTRQFLPTAWRYLMLTLLFAFGMTVGSCNRLADLTAECQERGRVTLEDGQHWCLSLVSMEN